MANNIKGHLTEVVLKQRSLKERIAELQTERGSLIDLIKEHQESQGRITYTCDLPCPNYKDWLK